MEKQLKGDKSASVHLVCSGTKSDKLAMAPMSKLDCLMCAWWRLFVLYAQRDTGVVAFDTGVVANMKTAMVAARAMWGTLRAFLTSMGRTHSSTTRHHRPICQEVQVLLFPKKSGKASRAR